MWKRNWSNRVVLRYTLLQLPALALFIAVLVAAQKWVTLPAWFVWGAVILWVLKDSVLFPFVWRAYDWDGRDRRHDMIGLTGIAKERIDPSGYALVRGELWRAVVEDGTPPVEKGRRIRVKGVRGLTLTVGPVREEANGILE